MESNNNAPPKGREKNVLFNTLEGLNVACAMTDPTSTTTRRDSSQSTEKKKSTRRRSREADPLDSDSSPHLPPPPPPPPPPQTRIPKKPLTVKDVLSHNPEEDTCEQYIQQALETRVDEGDYQNGILTHVPEDRSHNFEEQGEKDALEPDRASLLQQPSHASIPKAQPTTGATLIGLSAELQMLHGSALPPPSNSLEQDATTGGADALVRNAVDILLASQKKKTPTTTPPQTESLQTPSLRTSASRYAIGQSAVPSHLDLSLQSSDEDGSRSSLSMMDIENNNGKTQQRRKKKKKKRKNKHARMVTQPIVTAQRDMKDLGDYFRSSRKGIFHATKVMLGLIVLLTALAALLYYVWDNPPCHGGRCRSSSPTMAPTATNVDTTNHLVINTTAEGEVNVVWKEGTQSNGSPSGGGGTSSTGGFALPPVLTKIPDALRNTAISWWLLFAVRQIITHIMARATQGIVVDFLSLRTKLSLRIFGPFVTLFFVQARGFPFVMFFWALYDFLLLWGERPFASHWLYSQDKSWLEMNSEANPVASITTNIYYTRILIIMMLLGVLVAIKRFWLSLWLGRQTFRRYANELAKVIKNALYVGQVAALARDLEILFIQNTEEDHKERIRALMADIEERKMGEATPEVGSIMGDNNKGDRLFMGADLNEMQREKIDEILGAFEEPERASATQQSVKISDIIQFRQSLSYLHTNFPFTLAFGPCDTRESCIQSSEKVYRRLARQTDASVLHFEAISLLGINTDGSLNEEKLRDLVRLFRPERDGTLPLLDFAKSVDGVYKNLRTLRASVANSSRIDRAFEVAFNILLYFGLFFVVVAIMGVNPLVLFTSLAGVALSFNFMFSASCGKIFDGALLIFVRRPFEIGDRIAISGAESTAESSGSPGWVVKDVDLYTTTVLYGSTSEVATISNGSIASSRIINGARSPKAFLHFTIKFPLDTQYQQLKVFKTCIEKFIRDRPRQWASFAAFRATKVDVEHASVQYIVAATHRESWQQIGALLQSKADLSSFALELQKKMGLKYKTPPTPVDLRMAAASVDSGMLTTILENQEPPLPRTSENYDYDALSAMFEKKK